jgi:pimeloyl-ACP methyl ester carboxylesterase
MDNGFLELDGSPFGIDRIYYECIGGNAGRPCLVFLHEGLGCAAMWKDFPKLLCQETGCPGIVFDRPGYGKSSPLSAPMTVHFMHHNAFIILPALVSRLIPGRDFFLIGHSDGGSIGLLFASEKPALLRGIITEGAHVFVEQETVSGIRAAVEDFNAGKLRGLNRYHGEKTEGIFKAWSDVWLSRGFGFWNIEYALPSIDRPVMALQGLKDRYGTAAQVESIVSKAPRAEKCMIENCGHSPHHEQPEITLHLMKRFVLSHCGA